MNKVMLIGNITNEPELSYTQNQNAICKFTLAVNRPKRNGEEQGADFLRVVVWNKLAETCGNYLHKGSKCAIEGTIRTGSYKNHDGATVYTFDVWAENVEFLAQGARNNESGNNYKPARNSSQNQNFSVVEEPMPF